MTREQIEQLNEAELYYFETDREEQWYKVGLQEGLKVADANPKFPWVSVKECLPPEGEYGLSIRVLVLNTDKKISFGRYDYDAERWLGPGRDIEFTHWMPIPKLPEQIKA